MISIVIPAYNEEKAIGKTIDEIKKHIKGDHEIVVVDNNSKDRTGEIAKSKGARVVFQPIPGYGSAYKKGLSEAKGEIIITGDADCTYPFEKINELIDIYKRLKKKYRKVFLNTNRFGDLKKGSMSKLHKLGNFVLTFTTNFLYNMNIKDSQSGMWIFDKEFVKEIDFDKMSNGMPFSQEIKIIAKLNGYKIIEIPITYKQRVGEKKLNSFRDGFNNLFSLFKFKMKEK